MMEEPEVYQSDFSISKWEEKIKEARNARINFEQQWYTNLSFYRGKQWVVWQKSAMHESGYALVQPKSNRKRLVFNRIMPIIRREYTKITREEPQYFVQPNSTDQSDIAAALTGEAIAEYLAYACKFNVSRRAASWWTLQTGTGFIKTIYDAIGTLPVGKNGREMAGKVVYEAPSPFHIIVPFLELEDIEDQPWVLHERAYDPKVVKDRYGKDVEATAQVSTSNTETKFRNAINIRQNNTMKQVLVKELWIKPCTEYPEGKLCIWANGTTLYETNTWPYKHKEYPFAKITHIPSGGFYGISTIEGLIPMQKEYNLTKSQLAEARDLTSKPALVVTKGSTDVKKIRAVPGQVIEVMPGADFPKRLVNPDMPTYIDRILEMLLMDMDDNSSQFEVAKGRTPPGIEAASAIAYLQEENDSVLHHTIASLEEAVGKSGRQSLHLVQQFWPQARIINTISKTHLQGAIEFKGSDLKNNTDLRVVSDSMAPRSRAAKQASLLELLDKGIIDPITVLKHFQVSETNAMYDEIHVDINQVKRENLRLARGEMFEPNSWDNHVTHVQEHQQFMKTQEFELLPEQIRKQIEEHVNMHMTIEVAQNIQGNDGPGNTVSGNDAQSVSEPGEPTPGIQPTGNEPV
jgi:hypothetical protein